MADAKLVLRALSEEILPTPPIWLMRQAGRYLPEYRAVRNKAGDFLSLCYNSEMAAEVTLQPIARFDFDAAILFADILLLPHALGSEVWFVDGDGPRLERIRRASDIENLISSSDIHEHLAPVYETLRIVSNELASEKAVIGFAGAPWTVATYMIAGRGVPEQEPALKFISEQEDTFVKLIDLLVESTSEYLIAQIAAGAEIVKIFDSWAGALQGEQFHRFAVEPVKRIVASLKERFPDVPVIAFPRGAGARYAGFARATGADCVALDQLADPEWSARNVQIDGCVQGNLDPILLKTGGPKLVGEARRIIEAFSGGPYIFNLGHGVPPDSKIANIELLVETVRSK